MIGHILIQDQNSNCNTVMAWVPEGKRRRGRTKTTWRLTVEKERKKESSMGIMGRSEDQSSQPKKVKRFCEGVMWQESRIG